MTFRTRHTLGRALVLALVAGAVAVPVAQAHPGNALVPSPMAQAHPGNALVPGPMTASVATAVGFLEQQGLSAGQIEDWTVGVCSYETKPSSCYVTPAEARLASQRTAEGFLAQTVAPRAALPAAPTASGNGFDFGDAAVGFATAAGIALLGAGLGLTVRRRGSGGTLAGA
jgi:hypothetical protein